ncbi:ATP-binding protein [Granulicella sp. S190]|uniref:sensor histidine kinase n=1 Tax=Granulicella sp. S190 TaxID=1747226 RepID=UPI0020B1069F|nr:ATP-binding protein [Granulicella sp. S190]
MRTTLLIPLLVLSFGCTLLSLLVIRTIVQQQTQTDLAHDLQHSVKTYQNLQRQQRELLARESALLADLPSLKSLMTTYDSRTIADGGVEFWQVSGSDFFALLDQNGRLIVSYNKGTPLDRAKVAQRVEAQQHKPGEPILLSLDDRIYEIATQPLYFGPREHGTLLGFVAVGYAIDERVAREVSEAAAAQVAFSVDGRVVVSTLSPGLQAQLISRGGELLQLPTQNKKIKLGKIDYLAASERLTTSVGQDSAEGVPQLVVLKSFEEATQLVNNVNRWVLALALVALVVGSGMLLSISRTLTRPIETLVGGTRALAQGNFDYQLSEDGAEEIRELSRAFERMRVQLRTSQRELLDSERLATIGRMASSISHDLRHYLSAMYANAEFMSGANISQSEREELMLEVQTAVQGMTDLLDSLLLFTQTGRALHPELESIAQVIQRAVSMVRSHPAGRDVKITLKGLSSIEVWIDAKKLGRAVYNLLLNACQAAKRGLGPAAVTLTLIESENTIKIRIADNGPGVPEPVRQKIFLPFVSESRESGTGLGLTLALQIAQEHGGGIDLEERIGDETIFTINLPRASLKALGAAIEKKTSTTYVSVPGRG